MMNKIEAILHDLFEDIFRLYGYDFREYSKPSAWRRIERRMHLTGITSVAQLRDNVRSQIHFADQLIKDFSINVTEMFRDPDCFIALKTQVLPLLRQEPFIKIWHAGCATGEEVYSMAIILSEMGLYDQVRIYATDYSAEALQQAEAGIYPLKKMRLYTENYHNADGKSDFADYYTANYDSAVLHQRLKRNIFFSHHDLARDGTFSDIHLVVCRNVLIYFSKALQQKVFTTFYDSLVNGGYLCLGSHETLHFSRQKEQFSVIDAQQRIFRKCDSTKDRQRLIMGD
ncbi:MAG: protein-glutamate O-methyltransferase CheR, partial [Desulfatitalea sp.]|nr:protein-glutamate O-methyltransferase CheR [Desulfatitalea sp.]NNK00636.1 protein-glutamate O-methyltransferase CheR [Desulfatitalea sp.]